jgi:sensor domain CHASE-containing protein
MSLRKKTLLVIGATLFGLVAGLYGATSNILLGSFKKAEAQNTRQVVQEVLGVLGQTQEDFKDRFVDWAAWDDTYRFIEDRNPQYIQSNLSSESLAALRINLILYVNRSGSLVFGTGFDSKSQKIKPIPDLIKQYLSSPQPLLAHSKLDSYTTGILLLPEGPMLIASMPIITSRKTGPIRGTLIFGRYLNQDEINKLSKITRTHLSLRKLNEANLPNEFQTARDALINPRNQKPKVGKIYNGQCPNSNGQCLILVRTLSGGAIAGYSILKDIEGKPILLLRVKVFREIYRQGQSSQGYLIASVVIVGLIFGGVTLLLLEKLVLSRLARLSANVNRIGQYSNLSARLSVDGSDELSDLATTINQMLETVENSQRQLQESEERHRAVVEQIAEGIYLVDVASRRIIEANTALSQLLGYSLAELLEINVYDLIDSDRAIIDPNYPTSPTRKTRLHPRTLLPSSRWFSGRCGS